MDVTATIVDADLAMISGYQLFRIFFIYVYRTSIIAMVDQKEGSIESIKFL